MSGFYRMIVLSLEFIQELWLSFSWYSGVTDPSKRYQLAASQSAQVQSNYSIRLPVSWIIVSVISRCLLFIPHLQSSSLLNLSRVILFLVHVDSIFSVQRHFDVRLQIGVQSQQIEIYLSEFNHFQSTIHEMSHEPDMKFYIILTSSICHTIALWVVQIYRCIFIFELN